MTEKKDSMFELNELQLIQLKKLVLADYRSKYFKVVTKENELKNAENNLLLKTDFKALNLTNEKMRTAYISDALHSLRFDLMTTKYELKLLEDRIEIINDLIRFTQREVKTE